MFMGRLWKEYGRIMERIQEDYGKNTGGLWEEYGRIMERIQEDYGKNTGGL